MVIFMIIVVDSILIITKLFAKSPILSDAVVGLLRSWLQFSAYNVDGQLLFLLSTKRSGSSPKRTNASCTIVRMSFGKSLRCRAISQI